jgi:hypothetical protein
MDFHYISELLLILIVFLILIGISCRVNEEDRHQAYEKKSEAASQKIFGLGIPATARDFWHAWFDPVKICRLAPHSPKIKKWGHIWCDSVKSGQIWSNLSNALLDSEDFYFDWP